MLTLADIGQDGLAALEHVIAQSEYGSVLQAVASLSLFSHPDTVAQTGGKAIFPIVRNFSKRGDVEKIDGKLIGYDDNWAPTAAFMWSNGIRQRGRHLQFNHVYARSHDPDCYTALPNISLSPSFLAKLTDNHPTIPTAFEYRVFELYGWKPPGSTTPTPPEGYHSILWPAPLPAQPNIFEAISARLKKRRKDRLTIMVEQTGWLGAESRDGAYGLYSS